MSSLQLFSLIGLLAYFGVLLFSVTKEKKNTNVIDYFFAGRQLPFWALSITFIASWWGAGSALSTADLAYEDGLSAFFYYGVPVLISTLLMILGARAIRSVGYLTQAKMMEARYSKVASTMLGILVFVFMTITAASQIVGIGSFSGAYLGVNYEVAVIVGTSIVLIYSMFGGFRGVVRTDIIQFVLLALSAVAVFIVAILNAGGWTSIQATASLLEKPDYMNMLSGASKYMPYVITFGCAWMIQANVWQRISATKNNKDALKMTVMSFFAYIPLYLIVVLTGMAGIVLFDQLPEGGIITAIVTTYMSPVVGAIVFIGISAAIMSTTDSLINTGAMTLTMDLQIKHTSESKQLTFSKIATIIVTILATMIALSIRSILEISWIASDIITTGVFIPLLLGFFWRRGNSKGAISSMIAGFFYCFYNLLITFGFSFPSFWKPQSPLQVILGVALSAMIYILVSLSTTPEYQKADRFISLAFLHKTHKIYPNSEI